MMAREDGERQAGKTEGGGRDGKSERKRESETSESVRNHIVWISCAFRYKILLSATLSMILTTG